MCIDCDDLEDPCCNMGNCVADPTNNNITNCICCGGELIAVNGYWYHHSQFNWDGTLISPERPQDIQKNLL